MQRIEKLVTECETKQLTEQIAAEERKKEAEELERDIAKVTAKITEMVRSAFAFCHPFTPQRLIRAFVLMRRRTKKSSWRA